MSTMLGSPVLDPALYVAELRFRRRETVIQEMVERAWQAGSVRDPALLNETIALRERLMGTAIGKGVAVPHARSISVREPRVIVARSKRGIDWSAPDGQPVHIVLLVLSPAESSKEVHHDLLARAIAPVRQQRNRQKVLDASDFEAVAAVFRDLLP